MFVIGGFFQTFSFLILMVLRSLRSFLNIIAIVVQSSQYSILFFLLYFGVHFFISLVLLNNSFVLGFNVSSCFEIFFPTTCRAHSLLAFVMVLHPHSKVSQSSFATAVGIQLFSILTV
jgi:hypothetical protein